MKKVFSMLLCLLLLCSCSATKKDDIDAASAYAKEYQGFSYYRDQLNEKEQTIYDTIYYHLSKHDQSFGVEADDKDTLFDLYEYVLADHPEIFWEDGSNVSYTTSSIGDKTVFEVYASNTFSLKEIQHYEKQLDEVTKGILAKVAQLDHDYEKVKYIYDYVIDHTTYQENSMYNQTILSVFLYQSSVCAGYAKSIQYLLNKADIPCTYLWGGTTYSQEDHAWNLVKMDGDIYYLDATNGDQDDEQLDERWRYSFFSMTSSQMLALYHPDIDYMESTALKDNYFYRNDAYLDALNLQDIQRLLSKEAHNDHPTLIFQCETNKVCDTLNETLQDGNTLFDLAQKEGIIAQSYQSYHQKETNTWMYQLK